MSKLLSYHRDPNLKARFLDELNRHEELDQIEQGTYGRFCREYEWRGCAVACSLRSMALIVHGYAKNEEYGNHADYEVLLGVPEWLALLEDRIFEGLPTEKARSWPLVFAEAIPIGVSLDPVKSKFLAWLMDENIRTVESLKTSDHFSEATKKQVLDAIRDVKDLHSSAIGLVARIAVRSNVRAAVPTMRAAAAAASAAFAATDDTAMSVYDAAAWSADAAAAAARMVGFSSNSARWDYWERMSEKLLSLLQERGVESDE